MGSFNLHLLIDASRSAWVNASFIYGLEFLDIRQKRALGVLATPSQVVKAFSSGDLSLDGGDD